MLCQTDLDLVRPPPKRLGRSHLLAFQHRPKWLHSEGLLGGRRRPALLRLVARTQHGVRRPAEDGALVEAPFALAAARAFRSLFVVRGRHRRHRCVCCQGYSLVQPAAGPRHPMPETRWSPWNCRMGYLLYERHSTLPDATCRTRYCKVVGVLNVLYGSLFVPSKEHLAGGHDHPAAHRARVCH